MCFVYYTIVGHKYRNWTCWLNPKILQLSYDMVFEDPAILFFVYGCDVKMKIVLLAKAVAKAGPLSHKAYKQHKHHPLQSSIFSILFLYFFSS